MSEEVFLQGIAEILDTDPEIFSRPGTSVIATADRQDDLHLSHYHLGKRSILWTGSALAPKLNDWDGRETQTSFEELVVWAQLTGGRAFGTGVDHVLVDTFDPRPRPAELVSLDEEAASTMRSVQILLEACDPGEVDEAEFTFDDLDPFLVGWMQDGHLLALAGASPFDQRPHLHDIGVIVHPDARRRGLGSHVVSGTTSALLEAGEIPLYRCDIKNTGSRSIALGLGFTEVTRMQIVTWNPDHT